MGKLAVFYDGSCPICQREIRMYQKFRGSDGIDWINILSLKPDDLPNNLSREDALNRLHVRDTKGDIHSGAAAFVQIWQHLPTLRFLGKVFLLPTMTRILDWSYRRFLKVRPVLQRWVE